MTRSNSMFRTAITYPAAVRLIHVALAVTCKLHPASTGWHEKIDVKMKVTAVIIRRMIRTQQVRRNLDFGSTSAGQMRRYRNSTDTLPRYVTDGYLSKCQTLLLQTDAECFAGRRDEQQCLKESLTSVHQDTCKERSPSAL